MKTRNQSKKQSKSRPKTVVQRVRTDQNEYIKRVSKGGFRAGLDEVIAIHKQITRDPTKIMESKLAEFGNTIHAFASDNHYEHYVDSNLPALLMKFIKTGRVDAEILNNRLEKPISDYDVDKKNVSKGG